MAVHILDEFTTRPAADKGLWVLFLLPLAVILSTIKYPIIITPTYKLASLLCIGFISTSLTISFQKYKNQRLKVFNIWILLSTIITSISFHIYLHQDWLFATLSAIFSTIIYFKIYKLVLSKFERCFTWGEAGLICQSIIILIYFSILNIVNNSTNSQVFRSNMQISTLIIQFGLLGIGVIALTVYLFNIRGVKTFYALSSTIIISVIFFPLHKILEKSPILWILSQIDDVSSIKLMIYWSFCTGIAVLAISNQIVYAQKASTGKRKIFHVLAVAVFIPGLLYRCSFLYLASGVVTGIFFALEVLRVLQIPPLGPHLQNGFVVFSDEKDCGNLALTPIYLLAGCAIPMWIHPSPCDVTDSATFNFIPLMSGLLTIGVGDTAASVIGSNYGKLHWSGSRKTIEGTVACILAQVGMIYLLVYFGLINRLTSADQVRIGITIFISSLIEAKTSQVDNLVLPLISYIMLIV